MKYPPNKSQVNTDEIVQEVLKKLLEKMSGNFSIHNKKNGKKN